MCQSLCCGHSVAFDPLDNETNSLRNELKFIPIYSEHAEIACPILSVSTSVSAVEIVIFPVIVRSPLSVFVLVCAKYDQINNWHNFSASQNTNEKKLCNDQRKRLCAISIRQMWSDVDYPRARTNTKSFRWQRQNWIEFFLAGSLCTLFFNNIRYVTVSNTNICELPFELLQSVHIWCSDVFATYVVIWAIWVS